MSTRRVPSSAITGSASRVRRYEPPSPTRSRKRRYSVKQPSAMCWPLSGGGSGSPSRSGSVCTAPPSVGRASCTVTSAPASTRSSAAARPGEPAADDGDLHRSKPSRDDRELRGRREPARRAEDVEAVRLHAVELAAVETGERRDAERAPPVERVEQPQPLVEMHARALRLERHERVPLRRHALEPLPRRSARARPAAGTRGRASRSSATSRMMLISCSAIPSVIARSTSSEP